MPVDRELSADLARSLVEIYATAERRLIESISSGLKTDEYDSDLPARKLQALPELRKQAVRLVAELDDDAEGEVHRKITAAYKRGGAAAQKEIETIAGRVDLSEARQNAALQRIALSLTTELRGTHLRILRDTVDIYRRVVATAAPDVLLGTATRLGSAEGVWDRFLRKGITGFVDRSGRSWELASYVEMATRTSVAQAAVQGHLDLLGDAGMDLVIVSDAPQECKICRPWEGKILSRSVPGARSQPSLGAISVDTVSVDIAGSVSDAIADGLLHPNCRHSLSAYLPGVTQTPMNTEDPEGDKARQRLRTLERRLRAAKRQEAGALSPEQECRSGQRVKDLRGQIGGHVDATGLIRQRHREKIGTAR